MFDIASALLNLYIFTAPLSIFCVSHVIYSITKAKKTGIVRTIYPTVNVYFIICIAAAVCFGAVSISYTTEAHEHNAYISDLETRGAAALEDRYGHEIPEYREVSWLQTEKNYYSDKAETATGYAVQCAVNSAIFIVLAATCGAFITKDGVLLMPWFSPERPYAVLKNKYIRFYDEAEPGKLFLKLRANDENLELCKDFIRPAGADNTEPAKQN